MRLVLVFLVLLVAGPATAEEAQCRALVNAQEMTLSWDDEGAQADDLTFREWSMGLPGRGWNWAWGELPWCNSRVIIDDLSRELPAAEVAGHCLSWNDDSSWLLVPGEQNFRGRCKKTTCEMVNATQAEATALIGTMTGLAVGATTATAATGTTVVAHSSGALILTGSSGYIAGTLGAAGTTILGVLTAPATLTAAAVSVVAVGGAVYLCQE